MSPATQALHFQLLRLAKGALKAWEVWLRSQTKGTRPTEVRVIRAEYSGSDPT